MRGKLEGTNHETRREQSNPAHKRRAAGWLGAGQDHARDAAVREEGRALPLLDGHRLHDAGLLGVGQDPPGPVAKVRTAKRQDIGDCNKYVNALLAPRITDEGFLQSVRAQANGLSPGAARIAVEGFLQRKAEADRKAGS